MSNLLSDLRLAVRLLAKSPGFTLVAVATLALGIGANSTMFSILDHALIKDPPYPEPGRLALLEVTVDRPGQPGEVLPWSYPKWATMVEVDRAFSPLAAFDVIDLTMTGADEPERVRGEIASAGYFPLLGISAAAGRVYSAAEDSTPGRSPVVVLSHGLWKRRFGGDAGVVGKTIALNRKPLTVLGVAPAGFRGLSGEADYWVPLAMAGELYYPEVYQERWSHWLTGVGRIKPGLSLEQAREALAADGKRVEEAHPAPIDGTAAWSAKLTPFETARTDRALATSVVVLMAAVSFVLLIACASISNLLLARATARRHEMSVRAALGGRRGRLLAQLLTESLLLALLGGAAGLLFPLWGLEALTSLAPTRSPNAGILAGHFLELAEVPVDGRVLLFTFLLSVAVTLLFGLLPAVHASRRDLTAPLRQSSGQSRGGFRGALAPRNLLVAGQVAFALVLLVGAGLMIETFARLSTKRLGFDATNILTFRLEPPEGEYNRETVLGFYDALLERLGALPGVEAVGVNRCAPLSSRCNGTVVTSIEGRPPITESEAIPIGVHVVNPDYFRALSIPVVEGRGFEGTDRRGAPLVAILNQAAAQRVFLGERALGQRIQVGIGMFGEGEHAEVVGIAGDVHYGAPSEAVGPDIYVSVLQYTAPRTMVLVKGKTAPLALVPAIRRELAAINPILAMFDLRTMQQRESESMSQARFGALLLGILAAIAVTLASLGLYGVLSFMVGERRRELGIRMALGAERRQVLAMVTRHGLSVAGVGLAAGLAGALALSRGVESLLYGVSPTDPGTFAAVTLLLAAVAVLACYLPARRATHLEPMTVLKSE